MTRPIALYDACVLYPAPLRDLLMHLAMTDLIHAKWTDTIHDEWIRSVLADRPDLNRRQLERTRKLMNSHVLDALIVGYERLIPQLSLPDPDDRHVLAAAIHGGADVIVTFNRKDFPEQMLQPHKIETQHPDDFVSGLLELSATPICEAVRRQRSMLKNPPRSVEEFLAILSKLGMLKTVGLLESLSDQI